MHSKLLPVVAFILSLGVVGCDSPEVQDKVESLLIHGAVEAYAFCYTSSPKTLCDGTYAQSFAFKAYKFQDGSNYLKFSRDSLNVQQFNHRGLPVRADDMPTNGSTGEYGEVDDGYLETRKQCPTLGVAYTDIVDINAKMVCSGFNLEAFGIDD